MVVDSRAAASAEADTSKSQSVTSLAKVLTLTKSCCTRSRRFSCNRRTSEAVADTVDTPEDTHQEDMESHPAMDHRKSRRATAHPDMARAASLVLISVMSFRDTKSLST